MCGGGYIIHGPTLWLLVPLSDAAYNPPNLPSCPSHLPYALSCTQQPFTCGAIKPVSLPGKTFHCAPFRELDPARSAEEKLNEATCCSKPKTCGDFFPVSSPGSAYPCTNATEYNSAMADAWPPNENICCKVCVAVSLRPADLAERACAECKDCLLCCEWIRVLRCVLHCCTP